MSKNTRNRILLTALAALLLVTLTIGGTLAWLVDSTDEVVNTFTTAKVDIDLDEPQTDREFEMIPDTTYAKEPYVTVAAGSESCWVFVEVVATGDFEHVTWSVDTNEWTELTGVEGPHKGKVYYYNTRLTGGNTKYYILTGNETYENGFVKIENTLTNQEMPAAGPTLTFYAYACQAANVENEKDAWNNCKAAPSFPTAATSEEEPTT